MEIGVVAKLKNNLGATSVIYAAPSNSHLETEKQRKPRATKLLLKIQVVEKVECFDCISNSK
jgi:hypothetical protein